MVIIFILVLVGVIVFLFFSRNADTRALGRVDAEAVAFRQSLLKTTDSRVHEQLALLLASVKVFSIINNPDFRNANDHLSQEGRNKLMKIMLNEQMMQLGLGKTYLRSELVWYVFNLYLDYIANTAGTIPPMRVCEKCGDYLDAQFLTTGKADVCSFLKGEPIG